MRKVLSVMVAAIMLTACLTGCSDSSATEDSKASSSPESSSVAETTTTAATTTAPTTTTQATTTAAPPISDEERKIAEEFASSTKTVNCVDIFDGSYQSAKKAAISERGDKIYFLAGKTKNNEYDTSKFVLWCYDINAKKSKILIELEKSIKSFAYHENKIYITKTADLSSLYIAMFDTNGKKLKEFTDKKLDYTQSTPRVLDNGMIALCKATKKDTYDSVALMLNADLSNPVEVWYEGTNGNEHGIKSKETPSGTTNRGFYYRYTDEKNNKSILSNFDSETKKWTECDATEMSDNCTYIISDKYIFALPYDYDTSEICIKDRFQYTITDRKTERMIPYIINYNYRGGDYAYAFYENERNEGSDGAWCRSKPVNSRYIEIEYTVVSSQKVPNYFESNDSPHIYILNNNYYWYIDEYGLFLRTFEKGDSSEELVLQTKTK